MSNRRTATQIAADRADILSAIPSDRAVSSREITRLRGGYEARQTDLDALVKAGQVERTIREEYDTVYSPHFGRNGLNVACKRRRATYRRVEAAPVETPEVEAAESTPEGEVPDEVVRELPKTSVRPGQLQRGDVLIGSTNRIVQETQFVRGGVRVHLVNGETFVLNGRYQHPVVRAAELTR